MKKKLRAVFYLLLLVGYIAATVAVLSPTRAQSPNPVAPSQGPIVSGPFYPTAYDGDLRDLPQVTVPFESRNMPEEMVPTIKAAPALDSWIDPLAQVDFGAGQMPDPIISFEALKISDGGGWHPPDTNGDVGPNHYIQVVNIAIGIYDKATGAELVNLPYNTFFSPPRRRATTRTAATWSSVYDPLADRWLVTDFSLPTSGPVYECIAISQTGDPVSAAGISMPLMAERRPALLERLSQARRVARRLLHDGQHVRPLVGRLHLGPRPRRRCSSAVRSTSSVRRRATPMAACSRPT